MLHRATRATGWLFLIFAAGWLAIFTAIETDVSILDDRLDIWMRLLQLVLLAAIVGTIAAIWNAVQLARAPGRRWVAVAWAVLIALSAVFLVWFAINCGLLTLSLDY